MFLAFFDDLGVHREIDDFMTSIRHIIWEGKDGGTFALL